MYDKKPLHFLNILACNNFMGHVALVNKLIFTRSRRKWALFFHKWGAIMIGCKEVYLVSKYFA